MADPFVPGRVEAHEAGHAAAAASFGIPLSVVTVAENDQADPMRIGGFVFVESELFASEGGVTHIRTPLPPHLTATPWQYAVFLLGGLAAEIAAKPSGIDVDPVFLQTTAGADIRLIIELFQVSGTSPNSWSELIDEAVDFVFDRWTAISRITDVLLSHERIELQQVTDIVIDRTEAVTQPPQNRDWVIQRIRKTVDLVRQNRQ